MQINKRKLGRFRVDYEYIYSKPSVITEALYRLRAVPVEIQNIYDMNMFMYTVISDEFDEVSIGEAVPYYNLFVTCDNDGTVNSVSVNRRQKVN